MGIARTLLSALLAPVGGTPPPRELAPVPATSADASARRLDQARAGLATARREHTERAGEASIAASALASAEQAYDADPSDHNGQHVLAARSARDLAELRAERAARRITEAQRDLEAAEYAFRVACLERDLDSAAERVDAAGARVEQARAALAPSPVVAAMRVALDAATTREKQARADVDTAEAELSSALAARTSLEAELGAAAPERRPALAAMAEERAARERAELRTRGSVERFRQAITDDVEILSAAVLLIEERVSHIRATLDAQHTIAKRAGELGEELPALDLAFGGVAVLLALHQAIPRRLDGARLQNLLRIALDADPSAGDSLEAGHVRHRAQADPLGFMVLEWVASREPRQPSREMDREYVERILSSPTPELARRAIGELRAPLVEEQRAASLAEEEERVRKFKAEQDRLHQRRGIARSTP